MPGLVQILDEMGRRARTAGEGMRAITAEIRAARVEAQQLANVRGQASFAPPPPSAPPTAVIPSSPGGSIILGADGRPAVTTSTPGAQGGSSTVGSGGGQGGGGTHRNLTSRAVDPWLENTNGSNRVPLSWIEANCRLVDQPVLDAFGVATGRTQQVWDCGDLGTYIPYSEATRVSTSGGGGSVGGGGGGRRRPPGRAGAPSHAEHSALPGQGARGGFGDVDHSVRIGADLTVPGVESQVRETNRLLRQMANGDGGAGIRAGGGF